MSMRKRIAARIRAWRLAYRLKRFRTFAERTRLAGEAYGELLTSGAGSPSYGKELVVYVAGGVAHGIVRRACSAIAEVLVPSSVSLRAMTGRQVGRRRRTRVTAGASRESSPARSMAQQAAAPIDPMTDSMAGRITYQHLDAEASDTGEWLAFIAGRDDVEPTPVVELAPPGRHRAECFLRPHGRQVVTA